MEPRLRVNVSPFRERSENVGKALILQPRLCASTATLATWQVDDPDQRERNADLQKRLGSDLMNGTITVTEALPDRSAGHRGRHLIASKPNGPGSAKVRGRCLALFRWEVEALP
ncbi:hypothetical protein ACFXO9_26975 [Nocardia tengchongensis]|uniref:hypothetical protein n=1 Tax=Nocardia tengchongensis TaxID=2055889 RepID=UPI003682AD3C